MTISGTEKQPATDLRQLQALARLSSVDVEPRSLDELGLTLLERLRELILFDGATLYLRKEPKGRLSELVSHGRRVQFLSYLTLGSDMGLEGWVAANRRPTLVPSRGSDSTAEPDGQYRSIMSIPLPYAGGVIGVVNVGCFVAGVYNDAKLRLAELAADPIALALHSALQAERLSHLQLESEPNGKVADAPTFDEKMTVKLREAARLAAGVNHEINNPLAVIVGNIQCLVMEKAAANQKALSRMRRIEAAALRISRANRRLGNICGLVEILDRPPQETDSGKE